MLRKTLTLAAAITVCLVAVLLATSGSAQAQEPIPRILMEVPDGPIGSSDSDVGQLNVTLSAVRAGPYTLLSKRNADSELEAYWMDFGPVPDGDGGTRFSPTCFNATANEWSRGDSFGSNIYRVPDECKVDKDNSCDFGAQVCRLNVTVPTRFPSYAEGNETKINLVVAGYVVDIVGFIDTRNLTTERQFILHKGEAGVFINTKENLTIDQVEQFDTHTEILLLAAGVTIAWANGWVIAGAGPWIALIGTQLVDRGDLTLTLGVILFALGLAIELIGHKFGPIRRFRRFMGQGNN